MDLAPGTVLADRYRAEELLGRGGMGEVWRCRDIEQGSLVAVKRIRPELLQERSAARLFHAEVIANAHLSHEGIVPVYDLVAEATGPLLVMAYRPGDPLSRLVDARPPWSVVKSVLLQVLAALSYAHARSVLHLDIKPENVIVERRGGGVRATLVDFGIARIRRPGRGIERWFDREALVGTVEYMAPEQCAGALERFGPWTDLYAAFTMAYELCAGRRPFPSGQVLPSLMRRMTEPAPTLEPVIDDVPSGFPALVAEVLATDPHARPWCAADVVRALQALDSGSSPARTTTAWRRADPPGSGGRSDAATLVVGNEYDAARPADGPSTSARGDGAPAPASAPNGPAPRPSQPTAPSDDAEDAFVADLEPPPPGAYGLLGLRAMPVLGRVDERRAVWSAVRAAVVARKTSVVLLEGPAGVGKSCLARDALERAAELGIGVGLETSWSRAGSGDEGLRALVENTLYTRGASLAELKERLAFWLERVDGDHAAFAREVELLLRPPPGAQLDAGLPLRVAVDVVAKASSIRPVLLFLDDVQWSRGQAIALAEALRARASELPVCIIATARVEDDADRTEYAALAALSDVHVVAMDPLAPESARVLVRGLLDVDDDLCALLADRAEGNPLFVTQLLRQLVIDKAIERREGRFRLSREVDLGAVPLDIAAVWERRVAQSRAAQRDLAALAVVRERVSLEIAAELSKVSGGGLEGAIDHALEAGLLFVAEGEYRWAHRLLRAFLVRGVDPWDAGPFADAAAGALAILVDREDVQEERALHLRSAGRDREACEAMLAAGLWSYQRADPVPRMSRFERLAAWGDEGAHHDLAARAHAELAYVAAERTDGDVARAHVAEARARLGRGVARATAWVAFQSARVARLTGRGEEGARLTEEALAAARAEHVPEVEALALSAMGLDVYRGGDSDGARALLLQAAERHRQTKNLAGEAQILLQLASMVPPREGVAQLDTAVALARAGGAVRTELMARQMSVGLLWDCGEDARAEREAREVVFEAERRALRQTVSLVELTWSEHAIFARDWETARVHRDRAVTWGADRGARAERVHTLAIDVVLAAQQGRSQDAASIVTELEQSRAGYTDGDLRRTIRVAMELATPDLAARLEPIAS